MPAEPVGKIRVTDFGGLDTEGSAWTVDPRDSVDCLNVYTHAGKIIKRPAIVKHYTNAITDKPEWVRLDATGVYVLAPARTATNRTVYSCPAATPAGSWTDLGAITGVGVNDNTYPEIYGGRTIISPASTNGYFNGTALATLGGSPPAGSVALGEYNRMLFLSASAGGVTNFSAIDSSDSWLSSDTLTHGTMAGRIFAGRKVGSSFIVGGPGGIFIDSGYGRGTLRADGIASDYSICNFGAMSGGLEEAYAVVGDRRNPASTSFKGVIRLTSDGTAELLTDKVRSQWPGLDVVNSPLSLEYDAANRRLFMFPRSAAGSAYWWEYTDGNWCKQTLTATTVSSVTYTDKLISICSPGYLQYPAIHAIDRLTDAAHSYWGCREDSTVGLDLGTNLINAYWTTPIYRIYEEDVSDVVRWVYLFGKQTSGTDCTVEFQADNDGTWHVCGGGATAYPLQQNGVRVPIGVRCRTLQLRFTFGSTSVGAEIHGFVIGYTPVGNRA